MKFNALKKAAAALVCAVILSAGVVTAFAEGKVYSVPEAADMQITLPDDMTAVTRSSDANDKYFSLFGIDYATNKQNFENSNIYLQGMNSSSSLTVTVTMTETDESKSMMNYNLLDSEKLGEVARNFLSQSEYTSCTVDQAESNIVWLDFNTKVGNAGATIEAYQANTVYDGKSINVTLQRNGGNVTADDYQTFSTIVSSVEFNKFGASNPLLPYILIGAGVLLILIIVFVVIIVRVASRRRKKTKNDKILEELAGKYTTSKSGRPYQGASQPEANDGGYDLDTFDDEPKPEPKQDTENDIHSDRDHSFSESEETDRKYSDEEIDAMLGEGGEQPNFTQALPEIEEEQEEVKDDTLDNSDKVSEFFEDVPEQTAQDEEPEEADQVRPEMLIGPATKKFDFPKMQAEQPAREETETNEDQIPEEAEAESDKTGSADAAEAADTEPAENPEAAEIEETEPEKEPEAAAPGEAETEEKPEEAESEEAEPEEEKPAGNRGLKEEIQKALLEFESDEEEDDDDNDEVLVREEAKRTKFRDSDDFFEEAPKKTMGVISSKEIIDAEEYDVIGEMERRAGEVEKEPQPKGEAVAKTLKKAGSGVKNFFVHCGYFATNVRREIKRKQAAKKRQQYEEDRKRRARERAERQRAQAENGGLVQVHKRTDRKPASQQNRPSAQQRRPGSQQRRSNTQMRRPSSNNRGGNPPRRK